MKRLLAMAGVAALAMTMPALAKPGNGNGGGHGNPHADGGGNPHGGGGSPHEGDGPGGGKHADRGNPFAGGPGPRVERMAEPRFEQPKHDGRGWERREVARGHGPKAERQETARFRQAAPVPLLPPERGGWNGERRFAEAGADCPPGLAKKNNACLPPGQAKKIYGRGERVAVERLGGYNVPVAYRSLYYDNPDYTYRYDDQGYIYGIDRQSDLVSAVIPLLGGGFGIGQALPAGYDLYNLPMQYRDVYSDGSDAAYRYGDNAIYQVDPQSGTIQSIVALLTGSNLGIGQALPAGFDTYNLPMQYRDRYQDNGDSLYRYADGNIYQADAKTQIIQAIISALT